MWNLLFWKRTPLQHKLEAGDSHPMLGKMLRCTECELQWSSFDLQYAGECIGVRCYDLMELIGGGDVKTAFELYCLGFKPAEPRVAVLREEYYNGRRKYVDLFSIHAVVPLKRTTDVQKYNMMQLQKLYTEPSQAT